MDNPTDLSAQLVETELRLSALTVQARTIHAEIDRLTVLAYNLREDLERQQARAGAHRGQGTLAMEEALG